jgi:hypothetical protein
LKPRSQDKSANKSSGGSCACGVFIAIICLILEAIIFLFCVIGTPVDVFRAKTKISGSRRRCYSMWGIKDCGAHKVHPDNLPNKGFPSSSIRSTMNAAAAFAIISIFVTLVSMILTILLVCKCVFRVIPGVVSIIAFITTLIVWACQAGAYYKKYGVTILEDKIKNHFHYAGSFGLFVTAWCLQTIEMVLVFFA